MSKNIDYTTKKLIREFLLSRYSMQYTATQIAKFIDKPLDNVSSLLKKLVTDNIVTRVDNFGPRGGNGYCLTPRIIKIDINNFEKDLRLRINESDPDKWSITKLFTINEELRKEYELDESDLEFIGPAVDLSLSGIDLIVDTAQGILDDMRFDLFNEKV